MATMVQTSPTKETKEKAADGASTAALAAQRACLLEGKTRKSIEAAGLLDLAAPCVPVSPSGIVVEEKRMIAPTAVLGSPWCAGAERSAYIGCPSDPTDADFVELLSKLGLRKISLKSIPVDLPMANSLHTLLCSTTCPIEALDLRKALDPTSEPPIPKALLDAEIAVAEKEFGAEDDPEHVEKLQAAVEKLKKEYTTFEAGLETIARSRLDRVATVMKALSKKHVCSRSEPQ